jgi:hypothetical protein
MSDLRMSSNTVGPTTLQRADIEARNLRLECLRLSVAYLSSDTHNHTDLIVKRAARFVEFLLIPEEEKKNMTQA